MNHLYLKIKGDNFKEISLGLAYTYIGLVIFLTSVEASFMKIAFSMGEGLKDSKFLYL